MGRNTRNKIKNGSFKNRSFNIKNVRRFVDKTQKAEQTTVLLNMVLLLAPWAVLFASGVIISPVYAQGGADISTDLDTTMFFAGGICVLVLVVVFAVILKGKGRKKDR
jgi:hypothetical protein